jgi:tRNA (guanine26-N2/guanine27-N2)-dimethyltransferase
MEKRKPETAQVTKTSDVIQEGAAKIWQHEYATDKEKKTVKQEVFYNRVQVFNRDLTLLCMVTHSLWNKSHRKEGFRKLKYYDAFTASGLRALRAKLELPDELIAKVIGCDISQDAIKNFRANLTLNKLSKQRAK